MTSISRRALLAAFTGSALSAAPSRTTLSGIPFEVIRNGRSSRRYLLIHGNETTARDVLRQHMRNHKGVACLVTGMERNVPVPGGKLDPNRMFSRAGAEINLRKLNPEWSPEQLSTALNRLDRQRPQLIGRVMPPQGGVLIAVHNNSEGYNVNEELQDSDDKALNDATHPHEFFLATQQEDFRVISKSPYNVVLQNKAPQSDDGSLSRYMAAHGVRYVNLECELGKVQQQTEMLGWLAEHIR